MPGHEFHNALQPDGAHHDLTAEVTPPPATTGCPDYINTENADLESTGNGTEHAVLNNNLDGSFTTTFTGEATLTFTGGTVLTGHFTFTSGGSFSSQQFVFFHEAVNFQGTDQNGNPLSYHLVFHQSTNAAGLPHDFIIAACS